MGWSRFLASVLCVTGVVLLLASLKTTTEKLVVTNCMPTGQGTDPCELHRSWAFNPAFCIALGQSADNRKLGWFKLELLDARRLAQCWLEKESILQISQTFKRGGLVSFIAANGAWYSAG